MLLYSLAGFHVFLWQPCSLWLVCPFKWPQILFVPKSWSSWSIQVEFHWFQVLTYITSYVKIMPQSCLLCYCSDNINTAHSPNSNSSEWFVETLAVRIKVSTTAVRKLQKLPKCSMHTLVYYHSLMLEDECLSWRKDCCEIYWIWRAWTTYCIIHKTLRCEILLYPLYTM